ANNSTSGINFLGALPGCPDELTVGKGVPQRLPGFTATTANMPLGMCRYNLDNAAQAISKQDRQSGMVRGTFLLNADLTAFADLSYAKTKTVQTGAARTFTTTLASQATRNSIVTWPMLNGSFRSQGAIILSPTHPDNPTRGTANPIEVQIIPRFEDLPTDDINELKQLRFTAGIEGVVAGWDVNSALMLSRIDNTRTQKGRLRSSLLTSAIANGSYHFGKINDAAAQATIASDAVNEGTSKLSSVDFTASKEVFDMAGGKASVAFGAEVRKEQLDSVPDANYTSGDYIGLVANGASGTRNSWAAFTELRLPVLKTVEVQAALRHEHYDDFGNSNTGKLGFKWSAIPSVIAFRGTAATGFRAPGLAQIGNSFISSFHSFSSYVVRDSLRCPNGTSLGVPTNSRDCNVLGFASVTPNPGSIPTVISANPNLKPETSNSFTLGMIASPHQNVDLSIDAWYFKRNNEIRAQRGVDIMEAYNANPTDAALAAPLIRDPNPATWLPGVANSGPILAIVRGYGNFNWTKTSGIDVEASLRVPTADFGKFTFKISGTYTGRYDQLILAGGTIDRLIGTSSSDISKTKGTFSINWKGGNWSSFGRWNHTDGVTTSTTATCQTSTSAANTFLRDGDWCKVRAENTIDIGGSYKGFKNLTLNATVLNLFQSYRRSSGVPAAFNYWDPGSSAQLGRRFSLGANYSWD
ncbi:MAG TPA: TonB-dependent receptor, partial [Burkholderiaceae bacterium]